MKKLPTYFVAPDLNEFAVVRDAVCPQAGNTYKTVQSGFPTMLAAQNTADTLNNLEEDAFNNQI